MRRLPLGLAAVASAFLLGQYASAQYVTVFASKIPTNGSGTKMLPAGKITFTPALQASGELPGFLLPGGGQGTVTPVVCNVVNGAITTQPDGSPCRLPDTAQTTPVNLCFRADLQNAVGTHLWGRGYECLQPTGSGFDLDAFKPNLAALVQVIQGADGKPGPAGNNGAKGDPGTVTAAGPNGDWNVPGRETATKGFVPSNSANQVIPTRQTYRAGANPFAVASLRNIVQDGQTRFNDGTTFYQAAPLYFNTYINDTSKAMIGHPDAFSDVDVLNYVQKFAAAHSTSSNPGTLPPNCIATSLTQGGAVNQWVPGYDNYRHHCSLEGIVGLLDLENLHYQKSIDLAQFIADSALIDGALSVIPLDSNGIPYITPGDEWAPDGFEESLRYTGETSYGAVKMWHASTIAASLYSLSGQNALSAKYSAIATKIAANMGTGSAMWDSADGAFYMGTIQNKVPSNAASALFCAYGIPSPNFAQQCASISSFLVGQYGTRTFRGAITRSNQNVPIVDFLYTGGPPYYNHDDGRNHAGCYQGGGAWTDFNEAVIPTMALSNPTVAALYASDLSGSPDPTMEYWSPNCTAGIPNGFTSNLESLVGNVTALTLNSGLMPVDPKMANLNVGDGIFYDGNVVGPPFFQLSGLKGEVPSMAINRADTTGSAVLSFLTGIQRKSIPNTGFAIGLNPFGLTGGNVDAFQIGDRSTGGVIASARPGEGLTFSRGVRALGAVPNFVPKSTVMEYTDAAGSRIVAVGPDSSTKGALTGVGYTGDGLQSQRYFLCGDPGAPNPTGCTFNGPLGLLVAPSASSTLSDYSVPIVLNYQTYYLRLSSTP